MLVINDEMIGYVLVKYGNKWHVNDAIADVILDDLLQKEFNKQERVKEVIIIDSDTSSDDTHPSTHLFQTRFDDTHPSTHPFQTSSNDTHPSIETLKTSSDNTCSSDNTWEQKNQFKKLPQSKPGSSTKSFQGLSSKPYQAKLRSSSKDLQGDVGASAGSFILFSGTLGFLTRHCEPTNSRATTLLDSMESALVNLCGQ
ncbi:hypothetical protein Tco_0784251 [Tanacetum coccineum]